MRYTLGLCQYQYFSVYVTYLNFLNLELIFYLPVVINIHGNSNMSINPGYYLVNLLCIKILKFSNTEPPPPDVFYFSQK